MEAPKPLNNDVGGAKSFFFCFYFILFFSPEPIDAACVYIWLMFACICGVFSKVRESPEKAPL